MLERLCSRPRFIALTSSTWCPAGKINDFNESTIFPCNVSRIELYWTHSALITTPELVTVKLRRNNEVFQLHLCVCESEQMISVLHTAAANTQDVMYDTCVFSVEHLCCCLKSQQMTRHFSFLLLTTNQCLCSTFSLLITWSICSTIGDIQVHFVPLSFAWTFHAAGTVDDCVFVPVVCPQPVILQPLTSVFVLFLIHVLGQNWYFPPMHCWCSKYFHQPNTQLVPFLTMTPLPLPAVLLV